MNEDLVSAAARLADLLQRENAALAAMDLVRAAGLLAEKRIAADAFAVAQTLADPLQHEPTLVDAATRLRDLAVENQHLLKRALAVQSRVIGVLRDAMPPAVAPRYAASGALARSARSVAFTLSAQA